MTVEVRELNRLRRDFLDPACGACRSDLVWT